MTPRQRWDRLVHAAVDAIEHHEAQRHADELAERLAAADAARAVAPVRLPSRRAVEAAGHAR